MRLCRKPAAVVFDMDGLLFNTERLYQEALVLAAAEGGHQVAQEVFNRTVDVPGAQSRAMLLSHFDQLWRSISGVGGDDDSDGAQSPGTERRNPDAVYLRCP
jgi:beta-phosphoglucomutase-like phosphatase (HAD superfamily)